MDKGDPETVPADAVLRVNQFDSLIDELFECFGDIVDLICNMVEALAALGHETTDGATRISRLNQLDRA